MRRWEERENSSRHGVRRLPVRLITWTVPMAVPAISSRTAGFPISSTILSGPSGKAAAAWRLGTKLLSLLRRRLRDLTGIEHKMPWFGQSIDAGDGRCYHGRDWVRPWKKRLKLYWNPARSSLHPDVDIPAGGSSRALTRHPGLRIRLSVRGSARSACIPGSGAGACSAPAVVCPGSSVPSRLRAATHVLRDGAPHHRLEPLFNRARRSHAPGNTNRSCQSASAGGRRPT